jgi:hypothetical protein
MDTKELDQEILDSCGLEADELLDLPGRIDKIDWKGGSAWERGKRVPGNANLVIYAIFATSSDEERVHHVEYVPGDVRIYALPEQSLPGDSFRRLTINRASPAITHEPLTRDSFVQEVTREIEELSTLESESLHGECQACENDTRPEAVFCDQCGARLPEDEEEPDVSNGQTIPALVVAASSEAG